MTKITVLQGDISKQSVDVIVNAANRMLLGGGGVDGAIHQAAGPKLLEECKALGVCQTGEAKITRGYNLPAKFVIHTVGPVYGREFGNESKLLRNCYKNSLLLAKQHHLKTIAFPAISTGVYGFPKVEAVTIVHSVLQEFTKDNYFSEIRLVVHSEEDKKLYDKYFSAVV